MPSEFSSSFLSWSTSAYDGDPRRPQSEFEVRVTYHDSCSGLRELGIKEQPRKLLTSIKGVELIEMADSEICCGFGGTFSIKYPDISNAMVEKKTANIAAAEPALVLAGDLGCLMNMAGKDDEGGTGRLPPATSPRCSRVSLPSRQSRGASSGPAGSTDTHTYPGDQHQDVPRPARASRRVSGI